MSNISIFENSFERSNAQRIFSKNPKFQNFSTPTNTARINHSSDVNSSPSSTSSTSEDEYEEPVSKKSFKKYIYDQDMIRNNLSAISSSETISNTQNSPNQVSPRSASSSNHSTPSRQHILKERERPTSSVNNTKKSSDSEEQDQSLDSHNFASSKDVKDIKAMLKIVITQNKDLSEQNKKLCGRVDHLEDKCLKKEKKRIDVPNDIKHQIKLAIQEWDKKGKPLWKLEKNSGPFHEENIDLTRYIRKFVDGINPNLSNKDQIITAGIKIHYNSKFSLKRKKDRNPNLNKDTAKNQRKIHKAERRRKTLEKNIGAETIAPYSKEDIKKTLIPEMMSSEEEEEDEDGRRIFVVHKPSCRSSLYEKLVHVLDDTYKKNCSKRSKDQLIKRVPGEKSVKSPPKLLFGNDTFLE